MNSTNRISARALLAIASLAASPAAWSLGLGDATVESYLNQPLEVRIDLITQASDDLGSVSARLASAADYEMIGASLEDLTVPVRFDVENIGGDAYIKASSDLPVNSPVMRLIVEVNWSSGRMLREYTLFLDPPTLADQAAPLPRIDQRSEPAPEPARQAPPPPVSAPASRQEPSETVSAAQPDAPPAQAEPPQTTPSSAVTSRAGTPVDGQYGPVAGGETLWKIARDWSSGRGISVNQAMIAIQRENPQAFIDNNINLLKRGAILRMPAVEAVQDIPTAEAYSEVVAQEEAFREGRSFVSSPATPLLSDERAADASDFTIPDLAPAEDTESGEADEPTLDAEAGIAGTEVESPVAEDFESAQDASSVDPEAAPSEPVVTDQLELVPPSEASELDSTYGFEENPSDGDAAMASQALRENLARAEEDLINQQQQNEYLQQRIRELEEALENSREDAVADPELAAMEQRLREQRESARSTEDAGPWYARWGVWLLGLLVLAAAAAGWLFSRRSGEDSGEETIQGIKDEAEEVLRVLEDPDESAAAATPVVPAADTGEDEGGETEPDDAETEEDSETGTETPEQPAGKAPKTRFGGSEDEASFLDTESSDPEIQLDLARAYISMGDKEAARVILEEVAANGSEAQQAEAKKMLEHL